VIVRCLHGLGGTGATMWPLVAALSDAGHVAIAPTLPGHGSSPEDLAGVSWERWLECASEQPVDVLVGQSAGGTLALALAASQPAGLRGVVAINPVGADPDALDGLEWRRSRGVEWIDAVPAMEGELAYDRLPIGSLVELARGAAATDLGAVRCPVLIVTSRDDEAVDPASADQIAAALGGPVHRLTIPGGHTATLGASRVELCAAVIAFVQLAQSDER